MLLRFTWTIGIAAFGIFHATSCRTRGSGSEIRVTNPIAAGEMFPEVVAIELIDSQGHIFGCSGTFIGQNLILTAAHCLYNDSGERGMIIRYQAPDGRYHIAKAFSAGSYDDTLDAAETLKNDIAILSFDQRIAPKVAIVSKILPKRDTEVIIVGFGETDTIRERGAGAKHYGNNSVLKVEGSTSILLGYSSAKVPAEQPGVRSVAGQGDSGGAIFNKKGELIGVIGVGGFLGQRDKDGVKASSTGFVNISHPESLEQLKEIAGRMCEN